MSTPAVIRFTGKNGNPVAGLFIHFDANLARLIEDLLYVNKCIIPFPISMWPERIQARQAAAAIRAVPQEKLLFAQSIEEYAFFFGACYFNMVSDYSNHNASFPWPEAANEFFNSIEGQVSILSLSSKYRDNVCYQIDISYPSSNKLDISNEMNVVITTGNGEQVFVGDMRDLHDKKTDLLKN